MSKLIINRTTLTDIANAIRIVGGKKDKIPVTKLADAILDLGKDVERLSIDVNGDGSFFNYNGRIDNMINDTRNTINFTGVSNARSMFENSNLEVIPDINFNNVDDMTKMFKNCTNLKELPIITGSVNTYKVSGSTKYYSCGLSQTFYNCFNLKSIPIDLFLTLGGRSNNNTDYWPYPGNKTTPIAQFYYVFDSMFYGCYSLRQAPNLCLFMLNKTDDYGTDYNGQRPATSKNIGIYFEPYYETFRFCYALDEVVNYPVFKDYIIDKWGSTNTNTATMNSLYNFVSDCYRLKKLTFGYHTGMTTPSNPGKWDFKWANQNLDLKNIGYVVSGNIDTITGYNSGITADKQVYDDTTYLLLKDDPDWFTLDVAYSRYNKTSAIETIETLPDTSAYASSKGINTITFKGEAGSKTDGGAINTMSEEEIAVATAKGWTVAYA
jgi:hypothetical protein